MQACVISLTTIIKMCNIPTSFVNYAINSWVILSLREAPPYLKSYHYFDN